LDPFATFTGRALPFRNANVDTDVIIRIEHLAKEGDLGQYAFEALRYRADGTQDPDCVFNEARYQGASILIAGPNFGCGSSREGAVTAMWDMGLKTVIAPSFGDIFQANCVRNGLLPIILDAGTIEELALLAENEALTISLDDQRIETAEKRFHFAIDPLQRQMLLLGADEIDLTLRELTTIEAWQRRNRAESPWIWDVKGPERA
jgi:3-isopropylmalate/(R)-2-methylmalate dehydratase small subunit